MGLLIGISCGMLNYNFMVRKCLVYPYFGAIQWEIHDEPGDFGAFTIFRQVRNLKYYYHHHCYYCEI